MTTQTYIRTGLAGFTKGKSLRPRANASVLILGDVRLEANWTSLAERWKG